VVHKGLTYEKKTENEHLMIFSLGGRHCRLHTLLSNVPNFLISFLGWWEGGKGGTEAILLSVHLVTFGEDDDLPFCFCDQY
jgi:hypothetical protein